MAESKQRNYDPNVIVRIFNRGRLAVRLMGDQRVPLLLKGLPLLTLAYLLWPLDFISELLVPVLGPLVAVDDLGVILLGLLAFISMAPKYVVAEHERTIRGEAAPPDAGETPGDAPSDGTPPMVEGFYSVVEDDEG